MIVINAITDVIDHIKDSKVIIFDLDDTLYSEKEYVKSGFNEISKFLSDFMIKNSEEKLWDFFLQGKSAIDELLLSEKCYTEELKQKCIDIYRYQKPNIHLYYGVESLLKKLRKLDYKVALITDGRPEGQKEKIKALEIEKYFDKIIITDELGGVHFRKPNPKSFEIVKDFFECQYYEMVYIGDNINKDFIAPNILKMNSIFFENKDGLYYKSINNNMKGEIIENEEIL